jgi:hypothetical protein
MFNIHSSAKENFDNKAMSFLTSVKKLPRVIERSPDISSDMHVSASITEMEIIGELKELICDYRGKTIGRIFIFDNERYGLEGADYQELNKLAESVQRISIFRDKLSQKYIEETLFSWVENSFKSRGSFQHKFTDFLLGEAELVVKPITIRIPIALTFVEQPFKFCNATIKNISKEMVDEMASVSNNFTDAEQKKNLERYFLDFRKNYQGYAAVELKVECEPDYAVDFSLMASKRITDLLGIYSGALLFPDIKCLSKIKGTEILEQYNILVDFGNNDIQMNSGMLDLASGQIRKISKDDLDGYESCGLGLLSNIAVKVNPTEFEAAVLTMAFIYSKAAFTSEALEKLVYILSALESILLKSENEPIQQNIAERLAVFTSNELSERKAIIKNFKRVYGFRSKYLHHGQTSSELGELKIFFHNVWVFYVKLLKNSGRFVKKIEFLNAIDDHKLG